MQANEYEIKTALAYKPTNSNNAEILNLLEQKLERARKLASVDLSGEENERTRIKLADEATQLASLITISTSPQFYENFLLQVQKFLNGEINLYDLHLWTLNEFLITKEPSAEISKTAFEIKKRVYNSLKAFLNNILPLMGVDITDHEIDKVRNAPSQELLGNEQDKFEKNTKQILSEILSFLQKTSNIQGVGILYNEPITKTGKEILHGDIKEGRLAYFKHEMGDDVEKTIFFQDESHFVISMKFGDKKIGYLDFAFKGKYIDPIIIKTCRHIKKQFDTYLDVGLENLLKELIRIEQEKILEKYTLVEWRKICEEYMKILSDLGLNPELITKRYDLLTEGSCEIKPDGTLDDDDKPLKAVMNEKLFSEQCEMIALRYPQFFSTEYLKELGKEKSDAELMGALLFKCKNAVDRGIVIHIAKTLEDILKRREELRTRLIQVFGLQVANSYLDGKLETLGEHEIAILIGDINGYSKFSQALEEAAKKGHLKPNLIADIMTAFTEKISVEVDADKSLKGVLDKIVGDEVILLFRPPFDKDGRDVEGNKDGEHDISTFINNALQTTSKVQNIFEKVLAEIEEKFNVKMPWKPEFSFGIKTVKDVVGIFGNAKHPYSRLQYTAFGTGINETARIQSAAKAGSILVDYSTWLQYKNGGKDDFVAVGHPSLVKGKNIKDPIEVVSVQTKEQHAEELKKQTEVLQAKHLERSSFRTNKKDKKAKARKQDYYYFDTTNYLEMPDGDYKIDRPSKTKGPFNPTLLFENGDFSDTFSVQIPRDKIVELEIMISKETEQTLMEDSSEELEILRKSGDTILHITYRCIEEIVEEEIRNTKKFNNKLKQNYLTLSQLPAGKYKINAEPVPEADKDLLIELRRGDTIVQLLIPPSDMNVIQNKIIEDGYLILKEGLVYFEAKTIEKN